MFFSVSESTRLRINRKEIWQLSLRKASSVGQPAGWRIAFESVASMVRQTLVSIWWPSPPRVCRTRKDCRSTEYIHSLFYGFILNIEPMYPTGQPFTFNLRRWALRVRTLHCWPFFDLQGLRIHIKVLWSFQVYTSIDKHLSLHIQPVSSTDHILP